MIFQGKCFSYYILLTDQTSLSLVRELLDNMCIDIVCWPDFDFINFEVNLFFLINSFFYLTQESRQKCKHLENENSF